MNTSKETKCDELSRSIIVALERISTAYKNGLLEDSKKFNLSSIQLQIINYLFTNKNNEEKRTVTNLANEFNTTKSSISDTVQVLKKHNYLIKERSSNDFRTIIVTLTEDGLKIASKKSFFNHNVEETILNMSNERKELFLDMLLEIIHKLYSNGLISIYKMCKNCSYLRLKKSGESQIAYCDFLNMELSNGELKPFKTISENNNSN